ncbi:dephospho-CoA kinase [Microbacterium foliorum]|uniref:GrpB family protein n=1 Tax=Microbacterium foliorum TaxID=104336 RepID=UPI00209D1EC7|nr:GrpB family protein [Microbacterium foliorum]MCP1428655.1 dephospho-CoA kinase [Microbacterium foliorum]
MSDEENPAALVEHQPWWPRRAARLLSEIRDALAGLTGVETAALDHIGSTAVPGLPAKPFLDLQLRISPLPGEADLCSRLDRLGFERARGARPDSPGVDRDIPRGSAPADPAVWEKLLFWHKDEHAILHVRRADSPWGLYTIWFREWLRASSDARHRYETEKRRLSAEQRGKADYDDYTRAKTEFFDRVQAEFERWAATRR